MLDINRLRLTIRPVQSLYRVCTDSKRSIGRYAERQHPMCRWAAFQKKSRSGNIVSMFSMSTHTGRAKIPKLAKFGLKLIQIVRDSLSLAGAMTAVQSNCFERVKLQARRAHTLKLLKRLNWSDAADSAVPKDCESQPIQAVTKPLGCVQNARSDSIKFRSAAFFLARISR